MPLEGIPMHLIFITKHNQLLEGLLLAVGQGTIRVAARGFKDTMDLRRVGENRWMSTTGRTFEIASLTNGFGQSVEAIQVAASAGVRSTAMWN
jgi:hypothetical protein